jgi:hypothetical protein
MRIPAAAVDKVVEEGKEAAEAKAGELAEAGGAAVGVEEIRGTAVAKRCSTMQCIWPATI